MYYTTNMICLDLYMVCNVYLSVVHVCLFVVCDERERGEIVEKRRSIIIALIVVNILVFFNCWIKVIITKSEPNCDCSLLILSYDSSHH